MNGKAPQAMMQTASAAVQKSGQKTVRQLIMDSQPAFKMALGSTQMADHFVRTALTIINQNPSLAQCDGMTLLGALMNAAQLNLYPGTVMGEAYLIPYRNNRRGVFEVQFQIGYQGLIQLFYRHQLASELYAEVVFENDKFSYSLGTNRSIEHIAHTGGDRGAAIGYYAVAKLKTGATNMVYMSKSEMERWRNRYSRAKSSPWDSEFDEMAKKTVIKRVLKYMPKSIEMISYLEADETIKRPVNERELQEVSILPDRMDWTPDTELPVIEGVIAEYIPAVEPEPHTVQQPIPDATIAITAIEELMKKGYTDKDVIASLKSKFPEIVPADADEHTNWRAVIIDAEASVDVYGRMANYYNETAKIVKPKAMKADA